jgi:hypothetical protein
MRRALWAPLPPQVILDDLYTPMRLVLDGHRIAVSAAAVAHEQRAPARAAEFQRKVRTLTGVFQVCAFLPGVLQLRRNPVWAQFVAHKLLRLTTPWLVLAGGVGAVIAVAGAVGDAGRGWHRVGAQGALWPALLRPVRAAAAGGRAALAVRRRFGRRSAPAAAGTCGR